MRLSRGLLGAVLVALTACTPLVASYRADSGSDVGTDLGLDTGTDVGMDGGVDAPGDVGEDVVAFRCVTNGDCADSGSGAACDTTTGRCVECVASSDTCPAGRYCVAATQQCAAGCRNDDGCVAAAGDGGVVAGRCEVTTHACVACVTDSHCPPGNLCMGNACVTGCSATQACATGQTCCAGGCVDTASNVANCGGCGTTCATANGTSVCVGGACGVGGCTAPFADCNGMTSDGCETATGSDTSNCGVCGSHCSLANATAGCASGACTIASCNAGFANCDGNAANGCEVNLNSDNAHCGACSTAGAPRACAGAQLCSVGVCVTSCGSGQTNCSSVCRNLTSDPDACGTCGVVCSGTGIVSRTCGASVCNGTCSAGRANCDGNLQSNGCEVDTNTSVATCGGCSGMACSSSNIVAACAGGTCTGTCNVGFADCDGDKRTNGCEINTTNNASNCGGCGVSFVCPARANAAATPCVASACTLGACNAGFGDCDGNVANGCEIDTRSNVANCGACGRSCTTPPNAAATCSVGVCGFVCNTGYVASGSACAVSGTVDVCNYTDDNGDGQVDEGFSYQEVPGSRVVREGVGGLWPWPIVRGGGRIAFACGEPVRVEIMDESGVPVGTGPTFRFAGDLGGMGMDWTGDRFMFAAVTREYVAGCGNSCTTSAFAVGPDGSTLLGLTPLTSFATGISGMIAAGGQFLVVLTPGRGIPVRLKSFLPDGRPGSIDRDLQTSASNETLSGFRAVVIGSEIIWVYRSSIFPATTTPVSVRMLVTRLDGTVVRGPFILETFGGIDDVFIAAVGSNVIVEWADMTTSPPRLILSRWTTSGQPVSSPADLGPTSGYYSVAAGNGQLYWASHDYSATSSTPQGRFGRLSTNTQVVQPATATFTDIHTHYRSSLSAVDRGVIVAESNYNGYRVAWARFGCATPRQISPLSTATTTSQRPTLRWQLPVELNGARVQICRDRACGTVEQTIDVTGSSAVPGTNLAPGVHFWRLFGRVGTAVGPVASPTWEFFVGHRSAPVDTSSGTVADFNGDGYADLVVGARLALSATGRAYVYLGSASGVATTSATTLTGPDGAGGSFGNSVASAGDINGDGYADLVVGANGALSGTGRAYVYLGSAGGLATTSATALTGADGASDSFGQSVASAGDVNGDGYADLVVGAAGVMSGTGRAYVYLGSASGLRTIPATTLTGSTGTDVYFGASVASTGDVNLDGYADLVVAAPYALSRTGRAYVYLGSAGGLVTTPAVTLTGPDGGYFGAAVSSAADLNGDGYADLVVGAKDANRAYVYLGSAGGLATTPTTTLSPPAGGGGIYGVPVASAGDVNGDGYADLVVGAAYALSGTGRAYVYLGSAGGPATTPAVTLTGPDGGTFGLTAASAGDRNGDGYADLVLGAFGALSQTGRAYVYLGSASGLTTTPAPVLTGPDGGSFGTLQ